MLSPRWFPPPRLLAFVPCNNNRAWANFLDADCTVDKKTSKATCQCDVAHSSTPYVITGNTYTADTCSTGIISSATVDSVFEVTEFLKGNKDLPPRNFNVVNVKD